MQQAEIEHQGILIVGKCLFRGLPVFARQAQALVPVLFVLPAIAPPVFIDSPQQTQRFRVVTSTAYRLFDFTLDQRVVSVFFCRVLRFSGQPMQRFCQRIAGFWTIGVLVFHCLQQFVCTLKSPQVEQGVGSIEAQFPFEQSVWRIAGQGQDIANIALPLGFTYTGMPFMGLGTKIPGLGVLDLTPVHRYQSVQLFIYRAAGRACITGDRLPQPASELVDLLFYRLFPALAAIVGTLKQGTAIGEGSVWRNVEGPPAPATVNHDDTTWRDAVADAQLVKHIGVQHGYVRQHKFAGHQFKEHIRTNIAGRHLVVGAIRSAAGSSQRGLDKPFPYIVKVDIDACVHVGRLIRAIHNARFSDRLFSKRHHDKYTGLT